MTVGPARQEPARPLGSESDDEVVFVEEVRHLFTYKYQPSVEGDTHSPPATPFVELHVG